MSEPGPSDGRGPGAAGAGDPTVATALVHRLHALGVRRLYGLTGGHIKPLWDAAARAGIELVGTRHEAAAVHMAHAAAELTDSLAVATVTAGPGMTNALTGIAAASASRVPVLVLSALPPRPQLGKGAFEETPQVALAAPVTRSAATVMDPAQALALLDRAIADALGARGARGPAYLDLPVDLLRAAITVDPGPAPVATSPVHPDPDPVDVERAASLIAGSRRPLVISGAEARGAADPLLGLVRRLGGPYLDTRESRGLLPLEIAQYLPAVRGRAMREADLVITVGRRLDYELAYGSPAVFGDARFVRVGHHRDHTSDNRPGDAQVLGDVGRSITALTEALGDLDLDLAWLGELRDDNDRRVARLHGSMGTAPAGADARMHPQRLLAAVNSVIDPDTVTVADGGDILSFAAVALTGRRLLTPGSFGCLGVGVPFAVAAAIEFPTRRVIAVIGDGAFGFNAMEVATAVAQRARVVFVVANNQAWGIERWDRIENYADSPFSTELPGCRYDLLAQALGAYGEQVEDPDDLPAALRRALDNAPAVLDVSTTRDAMSPDFRNGLADLCDHQALRTWNDLEVAWRSAH